jgi:hypothetical protein
MFQYYVEIEGVQINGAPYLPEYVLDYTNFLGDILLGIQGCCLLFALGLI